MAFVGDVVARGRSFPIRVVGTITGFNRTSQMFTIRVDAPVRILAIAVGRDCKFKQHGAPTGEQILKPGARLKVSYFATIFTGKIAVEIESNPVPNRKGTASERGGAHGGLHYDQTRQSLPRMRPRLASKCTESDLEDYRRAGLRGCKEMPVPRVWEGLRRCQTHTNSAKG